MYWKKIVYLDYLEYGEKVKNVGHVRLFWHHDVLNLDVHLKGLYETDSLLTELVGITDQQEIKLGRLCIDKGCCYYNNTYPADDLDGNQTPAGRLAGICIRLSENRMISAVWQCEESGKENRPEPEEPILAYPAQKEKENRAQDSLQNAEPQNAAQQDMPTQDAFGQGAYGPDAAGPGASQRDAAEEDSYGPDTSEANVSGRNMPGGRMRQRRVQSLRSGERKTLFSPQAEAAGASAQRGRQRERNRSDEGGQQEECPQEVIPEQDSGPEDSGKVYEDKWQQLCHTFQVVHPFGEEDYISLTPKDFVILRQEYQQLVNNSFLLHGYYNYRHLILGKLRESTESCYYLGVPGTYYEREKMVAVMFGFEGFESTADRVEPGTFGYYMRKVQI